MDLDTQLQDTLNGLRDELAKKNEDVHRQLYLQEDTVEELGDAPPAPAAPQKSEPPAPAPAPASVSPASSPLIYFSYPMSGYSEQPAWVNPLRQVLIQNGYLVYNPWDKTNEQFGQQDLPSLNSLPLKVMKSICALLAIPEEVLLPFESVWKLLEQGDGGDNFGIVFQCLWFLTRSSLVVCDLMRPMAGAGTAQELLYSKQLGIPVVGLFPTSGQLNPFAHRSTTILFSGTDLLHLIPVIKGYVPT
jgi:hypothetical protein